MGSTLSLSLRGEFCLSQLEKTVQRISTNIPGAPLLTAINDAILEDLVFPSEIVGKRTHMNLDGSWLIKGSFGKSPAEQCGAQG